MRYEPTSESLERHSVPDWFHDAKLGIFVHWGPYSVPGWAPKPFVEAQFRDNSYAEWYWNTISIEGSPSRRYHLRTYGEGFAYDGFVPLFLIEVRFTQKGGTVCALLLGTPKDGSIVIRGLQLDTLSSVELLGFRSPLRWEQRTDGVAITPQGRLTPAPAYSFRISSTSSERRWPAIMTKGSEPAVTRREQ